MSGSKISSQKNNTKNQSEKKETEVEVLYQKLGNTWYAFSMIEDEVYVAPVTEEKITEIRNELNEAA
jgi:hypothetical protein